MISQRELERQISEYEDGTLTRNAARDLAALYIIRDYLFPDENPERAALPPLASFAGADAVPEYGETEFYRTIAGKNPEKAWAVVAELMDTLSAVHTRLYQQVLRQLRDT